LADPLFGETSGGQQKTKMVDKLTLGKKLTNLLKKRYAGPVPKQERSVLDTLLFAICLEDVSVADAEEALERLMASFHDLNEIRVSSISELALVFPGMPDSEWRAHRVRNVLQHIFEKHFEFAFEGLRRKTLDIAVKHLSRIRDLSPFVRNYTLQSALGAHVVPVDRSMTKAAIWLGLVGADETPERAAESLKSYARKADVTVFAHALRGLAVDPRLAKYFDPARMPKVRDPQAMIERLEALFKEADAAARKAGKKGAARTARASDGRDRAGSRAARGRVTRGVASARKKK
jgi:endonuclease-3